LHIVTRTQTEISGKKLLKKFGMKEEEVRGEWRNLRNEVLSNLHRVTLLLESVELDGIYSTHRYKRNAYVYIYLV
jgi:hypothetical protein